MNRDRVVLAGLAVILCAVGALSVYVWQQTALNMIGGLAIIGLIVDRFVLDERIEDTRADVDEVVDRVDAVEAWATGTEDPDYGRHADPEPPSYRSPTWPEAA